MRIRRSPGDNSSGRCGSHGLDHYGAIRCSSPGLPPTMTVTLSRIDGRRELLFEPLEFLERLAAMTPRPETPARGGLPTRSMAERVVTYGRCVPEPMGSAVTAAPPAPGPDGFLTLSVSGWAAPRWGDAR
jgi:hypothetical protein